MLKLKNLKKASSLSESIFRPYFLSFSWIMRDIIVLVESFIVIILRPMTLMKF